MVQNNLIGPAYNAVNAIDRLNTEERSEIPTLLKNIFACSRSWSDDWAQWDESKKSPPTVCLPFPSDPDLFTVLSGFSELPEDGQCMNPT